MTQPDAKTTSAIHATKQRLIETGLQMLLKHGYNDLGVQALLSQTGVPKGSFYHHFKDKEDFALQVIDTYMQQVHAGLDAALTDHDQPPLQRVRAFFEMTQASYLAEGYLGCLIGGLGQELSGVSETFRARIEQCFAEIAEALTTCLDQAKLSGTLSSSCDTRALADLLVDCWEGAALRSRLQRSPTSLDAMLDFYMRAVTLTPEDQASDT